MTTPELTPGAPLRGVCHECGYEWTFKQGMFRRCPRCTSKDIDCVNGVTGVPIENKE